MIWKKNYEFQHTHKVTHLGYIEFAMNIIESKVIGKKIIIRKSYLEDVKHQFFKRSGRVDKKKRGDPYKKV